MSATVKTTSPPDVIITGEFITLFTVAGATNAAPEFGSIEVALCGYGSFTPEIQGAKISLVTQAQQMLPATDPNPGNFEILLYSNALISPPGTYYTFTIKDANGDIVQCEAYRLSSGQYDLTELNPFDPNISPPPLPVPISNELQLVAIQGSGWDCDGADYLSFKINATQNGLINVQFAVPGNLYTFIVVQDATGGHVITWAGNLNNAAMVDPRANSTTIQTFVCDENYQLWAIGPGTAYL